MQHLFNPQIGVTLLFVAVLIIIAIGIALLSMDPEGRGGKPIVELFAAGIIAIVGMFIPWIFAGWLWPLVTAVVFVCILFCIREAWLKVRGR